MGFHLESMVQIYDLQSGSFLNVSMLLILSELQTPLNLFFLCKIELTVAIRTSTWKYLHLKLLAE